MIYCPHCKKPSMNEEGACPHCGENLKDSKAASKPRQSMPKAAQVAKPKPTPKPLTQPTKKQQPTKQQQQKVAQPVATPKEEASEEPSEASAGKEFGAGAGVDNLELEPGGPAVDIDQDDSSISSGGASVDNGSTVDLGGGGDKNLQSGLDLASIPPPEPMPGLMKPAATSGLDIPAEAPIPSAEIDELEIRDAARFGKPDSGPIGALKYWWLVYNRLKELDEESKKAIKSSGIADAARLEAQAALGRKGQKASLDSKKIADLISKSMVAEGELKGMQRRHRGMADEHAAKIEPLEKKSAEIEEAAEPIRIRMDTIRGELKELSTARAQIDTKKKRAEIELRNIDELIKKRQEAYADTEKPPEERKKLLGEISEIDKKRPAIMEQLEECDNQIAKLVDPITKIESSLTVERRAYGAEMEKVEALNREISQLTKKHSSASGAISGQIDIAGEKVEEAWAAAGAQIVKERCSDDELEDFPKKTVAAMKAASNAKRKVMVLDRCKEAYNFETVSLAKKIAIGAAAAVVILLVVLMVVL
jgi:predicted  nucleic acid-binding Zn-ribbon protein